MLQMEKLRPREFSYLVKVTKSLSHGTMGLDPGSLALALYRLPASSTAQNSHLW